jgi:CRP-like cAMP-binding protein
MFLKFLDEEEMSLVEEIGRIKQYSAGMHLIEEGSFGSSFYLILSGSVEVRKGLRGGRYKLLVKLGACDLVGEIGFLGVEKRTAGVVAVSDVTVLEFGRDAVNLFMESYPEIGMKIYRGIAEELAQRLSQNDEDLVDAISWAMRGSIESDSERCINVPHLPKVKLRLQHPKTG